MYRPNPLVVLNAILFISGCIWLCIGLYTGYEVYKLKTIGTVAIGKVDSVYINNWEGKSTQYIASFTDSKKEEYTVTNKASTDDNRYKKGDLVKILFLEKDPAIARIDDYKEIWLSWIIPLGVGVISYIFLFFGLRINSKK